MNADMDAYMAAGSPASTSFLRSAGAPGLLCSYKRPVLTPRGRLRALLGLTGVEAAEQSDAAP